MALHPAGEPHRLPAAAPESMLTTILVGFVIAAVVIIPSLGFLWVLDQKSLVGEDLT